MLEINATQHWKIGQIVFWWWNIVYYQVHINGMTQTVPGSVLPIYERSSADECTQGE